MRCPAIEGIETVGLSAVSALVDDLLSNALPRY